jgi:FtsH-binding integral membrane protein
MSSNPASETRLSPEQRRRQSLTRKRVFTAAMGGPDIQRRFIVRQRLGFAGLVALGLGAMFAGALLIELPSADLLWPIGGAAAFALILSSLLRLRGRFFQPLFFGLGLVAGGLAIGWALPGDLETLPILLLATLLIGSGLAGAVVIGLAYKAERSSFREFLWVGPWLLAALAAAWFLPASELTLAICGAVAVLLSYGLVRACREALAIYQPSEVLTAAADVVPLAFLASFRWLWGRD